MKTKNALVTRLAAAAGVALVMLTVVALPAGAQAAPVGDIGTPLASQALQVTVLGAQEVPGDFLPDGKYLLKVTVNLAPGTRRIGSYDYWDFKVRSSEGYEFPVSWRTHSQPHALAQTGVRNILRDGQWVEGELLFEVARDASGLSLIHDYQGRSVPAGMVSVRLDGVA